MNSNQMITVEQSVERAKQEVLTAIHGVGPAERQAIDCFEKLHDYWDANCFGGFCEDAVADELIAQYGDRDADGGMPQGMLDHINATQDAVDEWIKQGGLK